MESLAERTVTTPDDNIEDLRARHPQGLHFAVGDVHGEVTTLKRLMEKIRFDPTRDHVYFVGDYNAGSDVNGLMRYMAKYYQPDCGLPGFHMIRGNHERELWPTYPLENLPDVMVVRGKNLNFYIAHAGMVAKAFDLINRDMDGDPDRAVYAYRLEDEVCCRDAPLRQLVWSLRGLYSQRSRWQTWPSEEALAERRACILHGHSPYCFFKTRDRYTYGEHNLFWENQHVWFCEELRSFNLDANVKGRYENGETYRGLACLCMEVYDRLAEPTGGQLYTDFLRDGENGIFGVPLAPFWWTEDKDSPEKITGAAPEMKTIGFRDGVLTVL